MANTLVTCSIIAKESLAILENMLQFTKSCNTDFQSEFSGNQNRGYSPGQTINIKRPPRYQWRAGRVSVPQATVETTVPLTLSQGGTDMSFTGIERTLSLQQMEQKLKAAMATVANEIDRQGLLLAKNTTFNAVGGALPNSQQTALQVFTDVNQRLDELGAPREDRCLVMGPALNNRTVVHLAGLFNAGDVLSRQYKSGMVETALGLKPMVDQNVALHTNGTQNVAGTNIAGAGQTGSTINVAALGGTITAGTVIQLPGIFQVNPQNRQTTGAAFQAVVTADAAGGATALSISPAIVTTGPFQNATGSPTNGQPFTIVGTASASYVSNVAFHRDAFTFASVPLVMPKSGVVDAYQTSYRGINLRVVEFYDGVNDNWNMRFDVLYGFSATYPELACKYWHA